jgi:predicted phosphohydrolase
MRVAWASDTHLEFADDRQRAVFLDDIRAINPQVLLISGDIANGHCIERYLRDLDESVPCPLLLFVLGNHDYWGRSIAEVRESVCTLTGQSPRLQYLSTCTEPIPLSADTCVVGHDGWADGRHGCYARSTVVLQDYIKIRDFIPLDKWRRQRKLEELGDEAGEHLRQLLQRACPEFRRILIAIHAPPFREVCYHHGRPIDDDWVPHFCCKATGDAILEAAEHWPDREFIVLCGHTHDECWMQLRDNLSVHVAGAVYGEPRLAGVLGVE